MRLRSPRWISALGVALVLGFALPAGAAGDTWVKVGAENANVRSIAIDPTDQRRVYAAARNDGVWRSIDRGGTWVRSNQGLDFISAWGVSVDPSDPSKVWTVTEVGGAYRSVDHGKTWRHTHAGLSDSLADYDVHVSPVVNSND
ncbi:MAG TPA: hypothetical protein VNA87_00975, partial [Actinomycetota bacterium]|nr:hypothetical protein [Actinomycetota bacterium]